jgi:transcriptional regulator with XRE-family HTH domain
MPTIRDLREATGLTQAELANRLEVATATLRNWERGMHRPKGRNLARLATALGVDWRELSEGTERTDPC